jgi:hypothetical protein
MQATEMRDHNLAKHRRCLVTLVRGLQRAPFQPLAMRPAKHFPFKRHRRIDKPMDTEITIY